MDQDYQHSLTQCKLFTFLKYIDSGAAYVYTLILTITLIVSLSFIKWVRYHNHSAKLILVKGMQLMKSYLTCLSIL